MSPTTGVAAGLDWTLKRSFVEYVARMPDGQMSVTDGAGVDGTSFRFPMASFERSADGGIAAYSGDVRFAGHGNLLFVGIADPIIAYHGDEAVVSIQLPATARDAAERVDLANGIIRAVEFDATTERRTIGSLSLTEDGSDLFAGVYSAGDLLDDIHFSVPR